MGTVGPTKRLVETTLPPETATVARGTRKGPPRLHQNERMTRRSDFSRARRIPLRIVLETHLCLGEAVHTHRVASDRLAQPRMRRDELIAAGHLHDRIALLKPQLIADEGE